MSTVDNEKLKILKKQHDRTRLEIQELERKLAKESNVKLVDTYYKYRNSYSCPQTDKDYWWYYVHVTGLKEDSLECFTFETDKYGEVRINPSKEIWTSSIFNSYIKITKKEYEKALVKLLFRINNMKG